MVEAPVPGQDVADEPVERQPAIDSPDLIAGPLNIAETTLELRLTSGADVLASVDDEEVRLTRTAVQAMDEWGSDIAGAEPGSPNAGP